MAAQVLKALTRKFHFDESVDLSAVLEKCPPPPLLSGADFYGLASASWLIAAKRTFARPTVSSMVEQNQSNTGLFDDEKHGDVDATEGAADSDEDKVLVTAGDLLDAASHVTPSLTMDDIEKYLHMRTRFEGVVR